MGYIIRLDDITPDMKWEQFNKVRVLLEEYDIKPLLGVVPENRDKTLSYDEPDEKFWDVITELVGRGWIVAQHGTYHVYETKESGILGVNPFSEFAGLPYGVQLRKLKAGREILKSHGIDTEIFMAPGHSYDDETVEALRECGFTTVTDGLYPDSYIYKDILFVPCRLNDRYYEGISDEVDTICLHTNLMSDDDLTKLRMFLEQNSGDAITLDPDILRLRAMQWNSRVRKFEHKSVKQRGKKAKVASSPRLSWYMSYTNHPNKRIKWLRRLVMLPLLLTGKYKKG